MSESAVGNVRGQSRWHLYADKTAAIGAEIIAIHARGLFLLHSLDNRKQERSSSCCHHQSPQRLSRCDVSKRMKGMILSDRAV